MKFQLLEDVDPGGRTLPLLTGLDWFLLGAGVGAILSGAAFYAGIYWGWL